MVVIFAETSTISRQSGDDHRQTNDRAQQFRDFVSHILLELASNIFPTYTSFRWMAINHAKEGHLCKMNTTPVTRHVLHRIKMNH